MTHELTRCILSVRSVTKRTVLKHHIIGSSKLTGCLLSASHWARGHEVERKPSRDKSEDAARERPAASENKCPEHFCCKTAHVAVLFELLQSCDICLCRYELNSCNFTAFCPQKLLKVSSIYHYDRKNIICNTEDIYNFNNRSLPVANVLQITFWNKNPVLYFLTN